jgi:hypothetical protein
MKGMYLMRPFFIIEKCITVINNPIILYEANRLEDSGTKMSLA